MLINLFIYLFTDFSSWGRFNYMRWINQGGKIISWNWENYTSNLTASNLTKTIHFFRYFQKQLQRCPTKTRPCTIGINLHSRSLQRFNIPFTRREKHNSFPESHRDKVNILLLEKHTTSSRRVDYVIYACIDEQVTRFFHLIFVTWVLDRSRTCTVRTKLILMTSGSENNILRNWQKRSNFH